MISFRADLHCHSNCSDGTFTPLELISHAVKNGLSGLSITDHDTISAYTPELFDAAKKNDLELVTGIEFSTVLNNESIHLLGYDFSIQNPELIAMCQSHKTRREKRCKAILELLRIHGLPIQEEEILRTSKGAGQQDISIGRPHIAQMMVKLGYVQTIKEAFKRFLGDGCSCFIQDDYFTPEETIQTIHNAGGVAVIAHPHLVKNSKNLLKLLSMKFDGIECFYSRFSMSEHQRWLKIAQQRNWLITGGSDFHGEVKPNIPLGCSWIDEVNFKRLKTRDLRFPS